LLPLLHAERIHPAHREKNIIENLKNLWSNRQYIDALEIWQKEKENYPDSVLFHYWGAMILLNLENKNFSSQVKNYKNALRHLSYVNGLLKPSFRSSPRTKKMYINSLFFYRRRKLSYW